MLKWMAPSLMGNAGGEQFASFDFHLVNPVNHGIKAALVHDQTPDRISPAKI